MKKNLSRIFTVVTLVFLSSLIALAQDGRPPSAIGNAYIISADAGGVNYVEGRVSVVLNNGRTGHLLKGDKLEIGEKVVTETDGKAEVLLNPGSYVRIGGNSAFEFSTTSLEDLQLKLNRGSAVFEVITNDDFTFAVNTPKGRFYILESGVYRIDVLGDGSGKIEVWKGKAQVGDLDAQIVKSGRTATLFGKQVVIEKFDRDDKDPLELWSKTRAKELAKINNSLQRNIMRTSLMSSFRNRGWNVYDSYGVWVLDYNTGFHCFLPYGYGWNSPYGYDYRRDLGYYRLPWTYYQPPTNQSPPNTAGGRALHPNNGASTGIRPVGSNSETNVRSVPPYVKVQRDGGVSPVRGRGDEGSSFDLFDNSRFPSSSNSRSADPPRRSEPVQITPSSPSGRGKGNN